MELISAYVSGQIDCPAVLSSIRLESGTQEEKDDKTDTRDLVDAIWYFGTQFQPIASKETEVGSTESWDRLVTLVKSLQSLNNQELIFFLKTSLDVNLLVAACYFKEENTLQTSLIRINTKLLYRQQKYNLLREETEGYSKLILSLINLPNMDDHEYMDYIKSIFAIIGQFDLDPNRVVDIILDVYILNAKNMFFVKLLTFFRSDKITHILGFKLISKNGFQSSFSILIPYSKELQSSLVLNESCELSTFNITATLIASNIVCLEAILPYLSFSLQTVANFLKKREELLVKRVNSFGVISLNDNEKKPKTSLDTTTNSQPVDNEIVEITRQASQYISLINSLLMLDCINDALTMINAVSLYSIEITMIGSIKVELLKVFDRVFSKINTRNINSVNSLCISESIMQPTLKVPSYLYSSTTLDKNLDILQTSDLLLQLVGHHIAFNSVVFTKFCRLLICLLEDIQTRFKSQDENNEMPSNGTEDKHTLKYQWMQKIIENPLHCDFESLNRVIKYMGNYLLPGLTASEGSPFMACELWNLLSMFPFSLRYEMYNLWYCDKLGKNALDCKHVDVVFVEAKVLYSTKQYMKRLAKENVKIIGKQLSHISHYAPIVVFDYVLSQIEFYDNLIPYVVDMLRFSSDLTKDILCFLFVCKLNGNINKMKDESDFSPWYISLSKFIACFFKRYPTTDFSGLIQYLLHKFSAGDTISLLLFRDLLTIMGGADEVMEVSGIQIEGLSGGRVLRSEIMGASVKETPSKLAIKYLRDELMSSAAALPLLLFIAQIRNRMLFVSESIDLGILFQLYDMSQDVLIQYTDFLFLGAKDIETVASFMPSFDELVDGIGLSLPIAFQLVRPLLRAMLTKYGADSTIVPLQFRKWHPLSDEMIKFVENHVSADVLLHISPKLYLIFWSMSSYDIAVPTHVYEMEVKRLKQAIHMSPHHHKEEIDKNSNLIQDLKAEESEQQKNVQLMKDIILQTKDEFFLLSVAASANELNSTTISDNIIQHCVLERSKLSPCDAVYCIQFFMLLHSLDTKYFSTVTFMREVIKQTSPLLFCSTEAEASFLGFMINNILQVASSWHRSEILFDSEAKSKMCFVEEVASDSMQQEKRITHIEFENIHRILHMRLWTVLKSCLGSSEVMHVRCSLRFISKIIDFFPIVDSIGEKMLKEVQQIETTKPALQLIAKGVIVLLKKRQHTWVKDISLVRNVSLEKEKIVSNLSPKAKPYIPSQNDRGNGNGNDIELGEEPEVDRIKASREPESLKRKIDSAQVKFQQTRFDPRKQLSQEPSSKRKFEGQSTSLSNQNSSHIHSAGSNSNNNFSSRGRYNMLL